jgi:hypothetical protein
MALAVYARVVQSGIQSEVSVGQLLIYSVTHGTIQSSIYMNAPEGKVAM